MFDADRPITKSDQDRLNRTTFAKYLARSLLASGGSQQDSESLVVGLYGGWGTGKTSLINLIKEELLIASSNMVEDEQPIIFNFNPWIYSGQHQLIMNYFRRLSSTLRQVPNLQNNEHIIALLELYISFFTNKPTPKALRLKSSFFNKVTGIKPEEVYAWESGQDLIQLKSEIDDLLRQQNRKIIIFIDNISRLYDHEIKQIFQIVKAIADFANTNYLLSLDKPQVVNAINRIDHADGALFLAKVVQLPFQVPPILRTDLENILADRLTEIFKYIPSDSWNVEYWADAFYNSLRYFFKSCRDITRYVNFLKFSYPRVRDIVNPVDFFCLTALEIFMPQVYSGIKENKDLFTDLFENVYPSTQVEREKEKERCDEIMSFNIRTSKEVLLELLMTIFPRIRTIYHPEETFYYSDTKARKLKRCSSPDLFDTYFRLSLNSNQLPKAEFKTVLSMAKDPALLDQALGRLNQDNLILKFLDQLDSQKLDITSESEITAIITALLDNGDLFPRSVDSKQGHNIFMLNTNQRIHRIIHRLLKNIPKHEHRYAILQKAIVSANKSLLILVEEVREIVLEHSEESDTYLPLEYRDLYPEEVSSLQALVVTRIEKWAHNGSLITHPDLTPILDAWLAWSDNDNCIQYIKEITNTDPGLIAFLVGIFKYPIQEAKDEYRKSPNWENDLIHLTQFISVDQILPRAQAIFKDQYFEKLSEDDQLAVMIFLDLTNAETIKVIPQTNE